MVHVITVSDRASDGTYEDLTGPAVEEALVEAIDGCIVRRTIVPDEPDALLEALRVGETSDVVLTAGGTGLGPRDVTPETVRAWGAREVPGIAEYLRARSIEQTLRAVLSRAVAVQNGRTLAVNLPGSVAGARFCTEILAPLLPHAVAMMAGDSH